MYFVATISNAPDHTYMPILLCSIKVPRCNIMWWHNRKLNVVQALFIFNRKYKVEELHADKERFRGHAENLEVDKTNVEKTRQKLQEELDNVCSEIDKLKAANAELQRQRDNLEDEKEDLERETAKLQKEMHRLHGLIEQGEEKQSTMKEEFVHTKEQLARWGLRSLSTIVQDSEFNMESY